LFRVVQLGLLRFRFATFGFVNHRVSKRQFFPFVKLHALHVSEKMKRFRAIQKQSSERVLQFDPFSIRKLLPKGLFQLIFSTGAFFLRTYISKSHSELVKNITVKDFHISDCNFNEAFDLIALCQK